MSSGFFAPCSVGVAGGHPTGTGKPRPYMTDAPFTLTSAAWAAWGGRGTLRSGTGDPAPTRLSDLDTLTGIETGSGIRECLATLYSHAG